MDVGLQATALLFETAANTLERIEQVEQEATLAFGLSFASALALPGSLALGLTDAGRLGLYSTTISRAAAMMSLLAADSAVRRMRSTWRWRGFAILSTLPPSVSPISANSSAMMPKSGIRQRSMAKFLSIRAT